MKRSEVEELQRKLAEAEARAERAEGDVRAGERRRAMTLIEAVQTARRYVDNRRFGGEPDRVVEALLAGVDALTARVREMEEALREIEKAEREYRHAHDHHGSDSSVTGRGWDCLRRAGDRARAALRSAEPAKSEPACPGPDCPYCAGEACLACGAGLTTDLQRPLCEHDSAERHEPAKKEGR